MLNLNIESKTRLKMVEGRPYAKMTSDGAHFYCCTGKSRKIHKFNQSGEFVCSYDTKRVICAICFDSAENCFWAITANSHGAIFKLDASFGELCTVYTTCHSEQYKDISYSAADDLLFLCGDNCVAKLQKNGASSPAYRSVNSSLCATLHVGGGLLVGCKFQRGYPDIIGALSDCGEFDYLMCMPKDFSINNLCGNTRRASVLAMQDGGCSYLLNYGLDFGRCIPAVCRKTDASPHKACAYFDSEKGSCHYPLLFGANGAQ